MPHVQTTRRPDGLNRGTLTSLTATELDFQFMSERQNESISDAEEYISVSNWLNWNPHGTLVLWHLTREHIKLVRILLISYGNKIKPSERSILRGAKLHWNWFRFSFIDLLCLWSLEAARERSDESIHLFYFIHWSPHMSGAWSICCCTYLIQSSFLTYTWGNRVLREASDSCE